MNPQGQGTVPEPGATLPCSEEAERSLGRSGLESCEQGQEVVGVSILVLRRGESPGGGCSWKVNKMGCHHFKGDFVSLKCSPVDDLWGPGEPAVSSHREKGLEQGGVVGAEQRKPRPESDASQWYHLN